MIIRVDPYPYFIHRMRTVCLDSDATDEQAAFEDVQRWCIDNMFQTTRPEKTTLADGRVVFRAQCPKLPELL